MNAFRKSSKFIMIYFAEVFFHIPNIFLLELFATFVSFPNLAYNSKIRPIGHSHGSISCCLLVHFDHRCFAMLIVCKVHLWDTGTHFALKPIAAGR